jgi:hypothetical protein
MKMLIGYKNNSQLPGFQQEKKQHSREYVEAELFTSNNGRDRIKMQPTIHFQKKPDILISVACFFRKCSVGCIFYSVGPIITRK